MLACQFVIGSDIPVILPVMYLIMTRLAHYYNIFNYYFSVTISGTFGGFLLQAREVGKTVPIGIFSNPSSPSKLTECTVAGDSVTHSDANSGNITSFSVDWTPPSSAVDVQFV